MVINNGKLNDIAANLGFCYNQSNNGSTQSCCQGEESWIGSDLLIPSVWIVYWEPVSAQALHLLYILRTKKSELKFHAVDKRNIYQFWLVRHSVMMTIFHHV